MASKRRNLSCLPTPNGVRYPNGWYLLAESAEISIGQTAHRLIAGKDVALFRGRGGDSTAATKQTEDGNRESAASVCAAAPAVSSAAGAVFALDAVCPHLGANMAVGGKVTGDKLECPFHGWQFSGTSGACVHIPYSGKIPSNARAARWQVQERNGGIFVHYHVDGQEATWHLPPLPLQPGSLSGASFQSPLNGASASLPLVDPSLCFHGHIRIDTPGSVHELVSKHADRWEEEGTSIQSDVKPAASAQPATDSAVLGFSLRWTRNEQQSAEWQVAGADAPFASLSRSATLCFLGLPLASFDVQLLMLGPSLLYLTLLPQSALLRRALGAIVLLHAVRPDDPFVCAVELSAYTRSADESASADAAPALPFLLLLPLRRCVSNLLLRLCYARFVGAVLPVYDLGAIKPLSLHNAKKDAQEEATAAATATATATAMAAATARLVHIL